MDWIKDPTGPKGVASFVTIVGRKGSGKSVRALTIWQDWPQPRIVIDVTGSITKHWAEGRPELGTGARYYGTRPDPKMRALPPLPFEWPRDDETGDLVEELCFCPDPATARGELEEVDRAISLAYGTGDVLVWVDEAVKVLPASQLEHKMPAARALLNHGRHHRVSALFAGPRVITMAPLVLAQSDHVLIYAQRSASDVERISDAIGVDRRELAREIAALGEHEYLWWNGSVQDPNEAITRYAPVPMPRQPRPAVPHQPRRTST